MKKKNIDYLENLLPYLIALLLAAINLVWPDLLSSSKPIVFVSKTLDLSFVIFGFLLITLTLLMKSSSEFKQQLHYVQLIKLNKRIVLWSLLTGFYSLIFYTIFYETYIIYFKEIIISIYFFTLAVLVVNLLMYLNRFFKLTFNQYPRGKVQEVL